MYGHIHYITLHYITHSFCKNVPGDTLADVANWILFVNFSRYYQYIVISYYIWTNTQIKIINIFPYNMNQQDALFSINLF